MEFSSDESDESENKSSVLPLETLGRSKVPQTRPVVEDDGFPLNSANVAQRASPEDSNGGISKKDHLASTNISTPNIMAFINQQPLISQQTPQQQQQQRPSKDIKNLGTKARARLEEEKKKRPEIKVLDSMPSEDDDDKKPKGKSRKKPSSSTTIRPAKKKRKRNRTRMTVPTLPPIPVVGAPDISHIPVPTIAVFRSTMVQLHGLPIECTPELIKKFFTGLQVKSIHILISNYASIPALDAAPSSIMTDRYPPQFRVFAKFQSGPSAVLASERSGESMLVPNEDGSTQRHVAIRVTCVEKTMANALTPLSTLAQPNCALELTLAKTEDNLHPMVRMILWSVVSKKFGFAVDDEVLNSNIVNLPGATDLTTWEGYKEMSQQYNRLAELSDDLMKLFPLPAIDETEAKYYCLDSMMSLTTAASHGLLNELKAIEVVLYQARLHLRQSGNNNID